MNNENNNVDCSERDDREIGICQICYLRNVPLNRRYFNYDFPCECHSPNHFELVLYCDECKDNVKEPTTTKITVKTKNLKHL